MAEGLAPVLVLAALCGGEHEAAVLDGAGADQHMPMRLAGLLGESRRDREHGGAGLRQRAVERRETQVVADRQSQPAPRQIAQHSLLAREVSASPSTMVANSRSRLTSMMLVISGVST